MDKELV